MKYARLDEGGFPSAFYTEDVHGPRTIQVNDEEVPNPDCKIPADAVEITDEDWQVFLAEPGKWVLVNGVRQLAPQIPPSLEDVKAAKTREINQARETAINACIVHAGHTYDSDERSRANLSATVAALAAGIPLPVGFTWRTADNQDVPMDAAVLSGLAAAMMEHINAQYQISWQLKAQVEAVATVAEIWAIAWPK